MTVAETLQQDAEKLYERLTGTPFPSGRFKTLRTPLPPQVDPVVYLRDKIDHLSSILETRLNQGRATREVNWVPVAEVIETSTAYRIQIELPGLTRDDVEVHAGEQAIRITGERKLSPDQDAKMLSCERIYGPFERWIALPFRVETKDLDLTFVNGVLNIHVTKNKTNNTSLEPVEIR